MDNADVVVLGSGGAGVLAACAAADAGLDVAILERSGSFGGTTAVSGGMLWLGNNGLSEQIGISDSRVETLTYLDSVTRGEIDPIHLETFVDTGPELIRYLHEETPVRLSPIDRPDYNAHWQGGKEGGRVLDNDPFSTAGHPGTAELLRTGPHFPPLTYQERHDWRWAHRFDQSLIAQRRADGVHTLGMALIGGLIAGALERGVRFVADTRAVELKPIRDGAGEVRCLTNDTDSRWQAARAVVLATGGFEWEPTSRSTFLRGPVSTVVSPPWNVGDSLRMAMTAGAGLANMSEAWWAPTYQVPGETYDGQVMTRHMIDDLALPGTILVNRNGERFVNEATNYNDISKTFHNFDPMTYDFSNVPSYLVFDDRVKSDYSIATVTPGEAAPTWFNTSDTLDELAGRLGIDSRGLEETVHSFNQDAVRGRDTRFGRGERALDLYYGDPDHVPNTTLGTVERAPFHAIEVLPGVLGTKGGALTDIDGRVLDHAHRPLPGLWAVGNAAASIMGPGYPGAGGSLGPILTGALRCGRAIGSV